MRCYLDLLTTVNICNFCHFQIEILAFQGLRLVYRLVNNAATSTHRVEVLGYTKGRLEIPGFANWFADARCRVFSIKGARARDDWPYASIETPLGEVYLKAAEVTALCFMGPEKCDEVFRELAIIPGLTVKSPQCAAYAQQFGISPWAVLAASHVPHDEFVVTKFGALFERGVVNAFMRLHDGFGEVENYRVFPVEGQSRLFDHVVTVGGENYHSRQSGRSMLVQKGSEVAFRYRKDPQGEFFFIRESLKSGIS